MEDDMDIVDKNKNEERLDDMNEENESVFVELTEEQKKRREEMDNLLKKRKEKNVKTLNDLPESSETKKRYLNKDMQKYYDEKEEAKRKVERYSKIIGDNGELRDADLNNSYDRQLLAQQNGVAIYTPTGQIKNGDPVDEPKFRKVGLLQSAIPGCELNKIVPLNMFIEPLLVRRQETLMQIIINKPILNVPIKTPKLYLLLTGLKVPPIMDSNIIFKTYITVIRLLKSNDFMNSSVTLSSNFIKNKIGDGSLTFEQLQEWTSNLVHVDEDLIDDVTVVEDDKTAIVKIQNETEVKVDVKEEDDKNKNDTEMDLNENKTNNKRKRTTKTSEKQKKLKLDLTEDDINLNQEVKNQLAIKKKEIDHFSKTEFSNQITLLHELKKINQLKVEHIDDKFIRSIKSVGIYDNSKLHGGWAVYFNGQKDVELEFIEEIENTLSEFDEKWSEDFIKDTKEMLKNTEELTGWKTEKANEYFGLVVNYMIELLHSYEIAIMRLLSRECMTSLNINGIPKEYRSELMTETKLPALNTEIIDSHKKIKKVPTIHESVLTSIIEERSLLTEIRNKHITFLNLKIENANPYPNTLELFSLSKFITSGEDETTPIDPQKEKIKIEIIEKNISEDLRNLNLQKLEHMKKVVEDSKPDSKKKTLGKVINKKNKK